MKDCHANEMNLNLHSILYLKMKIKKNSIVILLSNTQNQSLCFTCKQEISYVLLSNTFRMMQQTTLNNLSYVFKKTEKSDLKKDPLRKIHGIISYE